MANKKVRAGQTFYFVPVNLPDTTTKPDAYTEGFCKRCNRKRDDCQKIIDAGGRCTKYDPLELALNGFPDVASNDAHKLGNR
jgi:hypothetical protein